MRIKNIAVMVSGGGTNLQALIDAIKRGEINARICCVISSKSGVYSLERAKDNGIKSIVIDKKEFLSEQDYDTKLLNTLNEFGAEYIVLAGFLSILSKQVVSKYKNKILNVHPSLIPSFCGKGHYGIKVHEAALAYGVKVTGATVHFVDEGMDTGPIVFQAAAEVLQWDTPEILQQRVMKLEHRLLPKAVSLLVDDRLLVDGRNVTIKNSLKEV